MADFQALFQQQQTRHRAGFVVFIGTILLLVSSAAQGFVHRAWPNLSRTESSSQSISKALHAASRIGGAQGWLVAFAPGDRNGKLRAYEYDAADNRIKETDHDNVAVMHSYDSRNRLASTTTTELGATTYKFDDANRITETAYANLAKEIRGYDLAGQLTSLKHERAGGTLHSEVYVYDPNGNRTSLTQSDGTTSRVTNYTFDNADRLLTEANPDERLEDTLDFVGNRTQRLVKNGSSVLQKTILYTINERDQITKVEEKNPANAIIKTETNQYDLNGNRVGRVVNGTPTAYGYDRRGRNLVSGASIFELNDGDVRTARTEAGVRTEMVMDGLKLQAEVSNGLNVAKYRWGLQLIGESRGGLGKTILQDSFRSPLIIADQNGAISDRIRYTAAGEVRQKVGSSPLAFGFGGYLTQSGTDELYAFARTYSPGLARFNEVDPVRSWNSNMAMGPHRYVLGYGNSLKFVDPDGRIAALANGASTIASTRAALRAQAEQIDDGWIGNIVSGGIGIANGLLGASEFGLRGVNAVANTGVLATATVSGAFGADTSYADGAAQELVQTQQAVESAYEFATTDQKYVAYESAVATTTDAYEGNNGAIVDVSTAITSTVLPAGDRGLTRNTRLAQAFSRELTKQVKNGPRTVVEVPSSSVPEAVPNVLDPFARYGGAAQRQALTNRVAESKTLSEAKGVVYATREMRRLGYDMVDANLQYRGNQGIDLVFEKNGSYAITEAKHSGGLASLSTDKSGLRQGSLDYNISRLRRYVKFGNGTYKALANTLLGEAYAGTLESFASLYRSQRMFELPAGWPENATAKKR
jgi:RHS repeat-associated protein